MTTTVDIGKLIVTTPGICGGRPRIAGRRLSVQKIAVLYKRGLSPQEIAQEYEGLTLAQVHAALAYYYANTEEIEGFLAAEKTECVGVSDRLEIDAALAEMANDPEYQAQVLKMEAEFATAQWEALQLGESQ